MIIFVQTCFQKSLNCSKYHTSKADFEINEPLEDEPAVTYCAVACQVFLDGRTREHFSLFKSWHDHAA